MSDQLFSFAVVKGASTGSVLRTRRKRIAVGSAPENDLVVADPLMAGLHFVVLIDGNRWRFHLIDRNFSLGSEERWQHPTTGIFGAKLLIAETEILLYPGFLEDDVIDDETKRSAGLPVERTSKTEFPSELEQEQEQGAATELNPVVRPVERLPYGAHEPGASSESSSETSTTSGAARDIQRSERRRAVGNSLSGEAGLAQHVSVKPAPGLDLDMDLIKLSQVETLAGERLPDSLVSAARVRLLDERAPGQDQQSVHRHEVPLLSELEIPETAETVVHHRTWGSAQHATATTAPTGDREALADGHFIDPESQITDHGMPPSVARNRPNSTREAPNHALALTTDSNARSFFGSHSTSNHRSSDPRSSEPRSSPRDAIGDGAPPSRAGHTFAPQHLASLPADPALAVTQDPDGVFATSVRLLGTRIDDFMRRLGYRTYMLTSCEPLTGKTTAALGLGLALAEDTHRRVAVIEANFRHPRFAEILGLPPTEGILPVLQGRADLASSVTKIEDRNLVLLPSGGRHPRPAEVLASPRFKTLVAELANTVDVALVDAPSIRPFADANLLQPLVDGVLLVVAEGSTPSSWLSQAAAQIGENRVVGALYNRLPRKIARGLRKTRKERLQAKQTRVNAPG